MKQNCQSILRTEFGFEILNRQSHICEGFELDWATASHFSIFSCVYPIANIFIKNLTSHK